MSRRAQNESIIGCCHHTELNCCADSTAYKPCPGKNLLGCTNRISFKCWTDNKRCGYKECKCQCSKCKSSAAYASFTNAAYAIVPVAKDLPPLVNSDDGQPTNDGPALTTLGAGNDPTISDDDRAAIATGAVADVGSMDDDSDETTSGAVSDATTTKSDDDRPAPNEAVHRIGANVEISKVSRTMKAKYIIIVLKKINT